MHSIAVASGIHQSQYYSTGEEKATVQKEAHMTTQLVFARRHVGEFETKSK